MPAPLAHLRVITPHLCNCATTYIPALH